MNDKPVISEKDRQLLRLELSISKFLRWGVIAAALLLATGGIGQWTSAGDNLASFREYQPELLTLTMQKAWVTHDWSILVSIAGLGVLVVLPICRVLLTAYLFIKQRDLYLALMAFFVFSVLLASFFLGIEI